METCIEDMFSIMLPERIFYKYVDCVTTYHLETPNQQVQHKPILNSLHNAETNKRLLDTE